MPEDNTPKRGRGRPPMADDNRPLVELTPEERIRLQRRLTARKFRTAHREAYNAYQRKHRQEKKAKKVEALILRYRAEAGRPAYWSADDFCLLSCSTPLGHLLLDAEGKCKFCWVTP